MSPEGHGLPELHAVGERVWVSPVRREDLDPYRRAVERSRDRLSRWNPVNPEDLATHLGAQSRGHRTFVIRARRPEGDHDVVGKVNVTNVVHGRFLSAAMGYDAYDPYAGRGMFAEGMRLVVGLAFAAEPHGMGLHRLEASVQPGNVTSAGLLRSVGFRHEGYTPRMLWLADSSGRESWRDHDRYAMTAEEWPARPYAPQRRRRLVVLVGGVPGSGRTTLARALAEELGVPLLSTDVVTDADAVWALLAASPVGAVVEGSFGSADRDRVERGLAVAGLAPASVSEVRCEVAADAEAARPLGVGPAHRVDASVPASAGQVARLALAVRAAAV
ncbi:MAG: GNAT family N-acetyltransferase [Oryzihumus sp.]